MSIYAWFYAYLHIYITIEKKIYHCIRSWISFYKLAIIICAWSGRYVYIWYHWKGVACKGEALAWKHRSWGVLPQDEKGSLRASGSGHSGLQKIWVT